MTDDDGEGMPTHKPDDLLTRKEAARYLRLSPGTLATWDSTKRHNLNPIKIGYAVRYRRSDLDDFLALCKNYR